MADGAQLAYGDWFFSYSSDQPHRQRQEQRKDSEGEKQARNGFDGRVDQVSNPFTARGTTTAREGPAQRAPPDEITMNQQKVTCGV